MSLCYAQPITNEPGSMCGLCDSAAGCSHPTLVCDQCETFGLAENMDGHQCSAKDKDTLKAVEIEPGLWLVDCSELQGPVSADASGISEKDAWEKLARHLYGQLNTLLVKLDLRRR